MGESKIIKQENFDIWTETFGNKEHVPILLLAATGSHAGFWPEPFCAELAAKKFFVIRYDYRDVGLSSPLYENSPYTVQDLASDVPAILDHYGIGACHLIGHTMGGYLSQLVARTFPERVLSLVLIATGPLGDNPPPPSSEELRQLQATWQLLISHRPTQNFEESLPGYLKLWRHLNGEYELDEALASRYTEEIYYRTRQPMRLQHPHMALMATLMQSRRARDEREESHKPMLIIQGEKDSFMLPSQGGLALAQGEGDAELWLVARMGHLLFNQALIKELVARIAAFLAAIPLQ